MTTTPTTDPQQALDEVAAYIRGRYQTANHLHIHREQPEDQVYMWEITSGDRDHAIIGAGLFPIAPGLKQQAVAERLRDLMVELSDDPSISVTVCPWDHDGGNDYSRVGIAEPDQDEEDPEVINELESIEREDQADEYEEPSEEETAAEVGEIMRESLAAAEDIRNYPDGTRVLPSWDQDPPEPAGYTAVLVPADETRPCIRITLPHRATGDYWTELGRHVGGSPNACQYDRDALVYVENNSMRDSAPNRRLTRYIWGHSEASAQHQTDPENPDYHLHGDAVVIGADHDLDPVDVPRRIEAHFHADEPLAGGAAARETGE